MYAGASAFLSNLHDKMPEILQNSTHTAASLPQ